MPTIFSHAIAASAVGQWFRKSDPGSRIPNPATFWFWTAVCAMLPDADVIGFSFGIPYDSMFGHRGLTHSIAFAIVVGFVVARSISLGVGRWELGVAWLWFAAVIASHGLLDACTDGGRGIAFLAPFSA